MRIHPRQALFGILLAAGISPAAWAGVQVTTAVPDAVAAEGGSDSGEFTLIVEINGNQGASSVTLEINPDGDETTDYPTDPVSGMPDFNLGFPTECPLDGGGQEITFSASSTGDTTFDINLGGFNASGGGPISGGDATFICTITVDPVDDDHDESAETLKLEIGGTNSKAPRKQSLTIGDNDTAGLVVTDAEFNGSNPGLSAKITSEDGTTQTFFVELATQPAGAVTVDLVAAPDTEVLIDDGGAPAANLSLNFDNGNWNVGQEVTITGQDDSPGNAVDGPQAFTVTVETAGGQGDSNYNNLAGTTVNGTNQDNDVPGQISLVVSSASFDEDTGTLNVEVTRQNGSSGPASVDYYTMDGTATAGEDFTGIAMGTPGTLNWADGVDGVMNASISITDDDLLEPTAESFSVILTNATGATLVGGDTFTATINPNDFVTISFSTADTAVAEGDAGTTAVPFTVTRSGGLDSAIALSFSTVDGSATAADSDYVAQAATAINFAASDTSEDISVDVNGDTDVETDESFQIMLGDLPAGVSVTGGDTRTVTINNDDTSAEGSFSVAVSPNPVLESAASDELTVTVTRSGATIPGASAAAIRIYTVNGSAEAGTDFAGITQGDDVQVSWAADTQGDQTITIDILENPDEDDESFTVMIEAVGSEDIANDAAVATITGDPIVMWDPNSYMVSETDGMVSVNVTRARVSASAVSVDYATMDGTAMDGDDYTAASDTLMWGAAEVGTKTVDIPILADADDTGPESFTIDLSSCSNCSISGGNTATVEISEEPVVPTENGTLSFDPTSTNASEGAVASLTVTRTGGSDGAVSVGWATMDGSAEAGSDYTGDSGTLNWADGDATPQNILISTINDSDPEGAENFTVELSMPTGGAVIGDGTGTVTIPANDQVVAQPGEFAVAGTSVAEDAGQVEVTVTRINGDDGAVSVQFFTTDGTAVAPSDYTAVADCTGTTVNFADGETAGSFMVDITDDAIDPTDPSEDAAETFTVTLCNPQGGATLASGFESAEITIFDNDGGGTFSIDSIRVYEDEGFAELTVTRSSNNGSAASVTWETQDGTATAPDDYVADMGELVWLDGDMSSERTISIAIIADNIDDAGETFTVKLVSALGDGPVIVVSDGVVTLLDPTYPVPTLGQWSLLLLIVLMLGIGLQRSRRRLALH